MKVRKIDSLGLRALGDASPLRGIRPRNEWVCPTGVDRETLDEAELSKTCRQVTLAELDGVEAEGEDDAAVDLGANTPKVSLRDLIRRKNVSLEDCVIEGRTMRCTIRGLQEVEDSED